MNGIKGIRDEKDYELRVDDAELALLIRAVDVLIQRSNPDGWLAVQDLFDQRQREGEALKTKLEEVKNSA
ncbi:MAG: hypothetical protein KAJ19_13275 [Gammaproteobacteria bacterium]|nr:hypothetical protein [Gammaproteobacteria bacterium]